MAKKKAAAAQGPTFETALARLEEIVRELEQPDLPLESSLAVFEEGVRLSRQLHQRLNEAERKVEILLRNEEGERVPVPFEEEGEAPGGKGRRRSAAAAGEGGQGDEADDEGGDEGGDDEGGDAAGGGQRALPF